MDRLKPYWSHSSLCWQITAQPVSWTTKLHYPFNGCDLDCSYRSQMSNICILIGCHVQCMRLFSCELVTFLMDHEYEVFDKNDMLFILFSGSVKEANGWKIHVHICSYHYLSQINVLLKKCNWTHISCPMLRGVRIGRNDVFLSDQTRKGGKKLLTTCVNNIVLALHCVKYIWIQHKYREKWEKKKIYIIWKYGFHPTSDIVRNKWNAIDQILEILEFSFMFSFCTKL